MEKEILGHDLVSFLSMGRGLGDLNGYRREHHDLVYQLAHGYYEQGKYSEALKLFTLLMTWNHLERRYIFGYAACMQMLKDYKTAIKYFQLAHALDSNDFSALLHGCECLTALGMREEAIQGLEIVVRAAKEFEDDELLRRATAKLQLLSANPASETAAR